MNLSTRISIAIHLLLILPFLLVHTVHMQAKVSKPEHMQLTYLARSAQAPAVRLVHHKAVKDVKAVPSAWCFEGCHGAPPTHRELFKFAGLDRYFVAVLPNGVHLASEVQDASDVQMVADGSIAPGAYKVTITTTDDYTVPTDWDINPDPMAHFTYIRVNGPGVYSLAQS
jgi:hypothetical protein